DLADPDFSDFQKTTGGTGSTGSMAVALEPEKRARPRGGRPALQAGITPPAGSGSDPAAPAVVADDQRPGPLPVAPGFPTLPRATGPVVNLPIIPGGSEQ